MDMRIGGREVSSPSDRWMDVKNPATGETIDRVPAASAGDLDRAVEAADDAGPKWKSRPMRDRGKILFHAAARVREQHTELGRMLTIEQGKPLREAVDEVRGFANVLEFYAGISGQASGEALRLGPSGDGMITREPLGVCGAIIPWNMPVLIFGWKVGPALLAGNTLVVKPASTTPLTTLRIAQILDEAGLPPGVLNIVTGSGAEVGEALVSHPGIAKISFTGSCATGARIRELASRHPKELILELGGSDPMIVMDDADLDLAAEGAVRGRFYNAGQTCTAIKRVFVHEKIAPEFTRRLKDRIDALNVGNGLGPRTDMGPLNSAAGRERIEELVGQVRDRNEGKIVSGGSILRGKAYETGFYYHPTLVVDAAPKSCLLQEEVFGPVLPIMTVPDLGSAIAAANTSRYALGASVWTKDIHTVKRVFDEVRAGVVWANRHLTLPPEVPFGGMDGSGTGRENGHHAIEQYSRTKTLLLNW